jgi:hypothetical protein
MSFGSKIDASYNLDITSQNKKLTNKIKKFTVEIYNRIQHTYIECCDALKIIKAYDGKDSFFYLDPPYIGSDMGHYDGYTQEDFDNLLEFLTKIEGKFLLLCHWYPVDYFCLAGRPAKRLSPPSGLYILGLLGLFPITYIITPIRYIYHIEKHIYRIPSINPYI